jgi:hypothetical protein
MKYLFFALLSIILIIQINTETFVSGFNPHNHFEINDEKTTLKYTQIFQKFEVDFKYDETFPNFQVYTQWGIKKFCYIACIKIPKYHVSGLSDEQCDSIIKLWEQKGVKSKIWDRREYQDTKKALSFLE